jgi:hypothetical protein
LEIMLLTTLSARVVETKTGRSVACWAVNEILKVLRTSAATAFESLMTGQKAASTF